MSTQFILSLVFIAASVGTVIGFAIGHKRGKALGWCEHHFDDIAKDRARRERNGRFKAKEARTQ